MVLQLEDRERLAAIAHARLQKQDRPAVVELDGDGRRGTMISERAGRDDQGGDRIDDSLRAEIDRIGQQGAEVVFREMLDLDDAGHRFADILRMVDGHAFQRAVRDEPLPSRRQIGAQVGDDAAINSGQ